MDLLLLGIDRSSYIMAGVTDSNIPLKVVNNLNSYNYDLVISNGGL